MTRRRSRPFRRENSPLFVELCIIDCALLPVRLTAEMADSIRPVLVIPVDVIVYVLDGEVLVDPFN